MPNFYDFCIRTVADMPLHHNFTATSSSSKIAISPCFKRFASLTELIDALETFQAFESLIRTTAIALCASKLAAQHGWQQETAEPHLHRVATLLASEEVRDA
jgi:hypothetical protein